MSDAALGMKRHNYTDLRPCDFIQTRTTQRQGFTYTEKALHGMDTNWRIISNLAEVCPKLFVHISQKYFDTIFSFPNMKQNSRLRS
jgi:hypothetical protein